MGMEKKDFIIIITTSIFITEVLNYKTKYLKIQFYPEIKNNKIIDTIRGVSYIFVFNSYAYILLII